MTASARNRVLVPVDFGRQQFNDDTAVARIQVVQQPKLPISVNFV